MEIKMENCLEKDIYWEGMYFIGRREDGKLVLLPVKPGMVVPAESVKNTVLFAEYAEKWLEAARHQVRESSYMKYWNLLHSYILPELGEVEWDDLDREKIEEFCAKMLSTGGKDGRSLSAKTVSDTVAVIRQIFRYAVGHGAAMRFDISEVTVKKTPKEMQYLSKAELEKLCRWLMCNLSDRNLGLIICIFTGIRLGELCALKWEDISFSEQSIYIRRTIQRIQVKDDPEKKTRIIITPPKSGSSIRKIPIPLELVKILLSCRGNKSGYVLTGSPDAYVEPRTMERHLKMVLKRAGLRDVNFHALRHTFATLCVEFGFDTKSLSEILGHSNVNITLNRYVHSTMEMKRNHMQKLSVLLAAG